MSDTVLTCPNCGHHILLTEALTAQLRGQIEASLRSEHDARLRQAVAEAEARGRKERELAAAQARESAEREVKFLGERLAEQERKAREAQGAELALRKEKAVFEQRQRELDLEVARRVDAERQRVEEALRKSAAEEQLLKLREKDKQMFGLIEGVWVASPRAWSALALALREQLVQVAFAHAASEGKNEKMELLYRYLAGDQFRAKVAGIVEAFTALQDQLNRERRAMERIWKEREKQIERVVTNTVGMYGEMRGLLGGSLPDIPALTLERAAGLLEGEAE